MDNLTGYAVKDPNYVLRFAIIIFMGVIAVGSVLFWRSETLMASDYQEFPVTHEQRKIKKENEKKQAKMMQDLQKKFISNQEEQ